jgi:KDO2-lipid IV(A) lauroyltransferase
MRDRLLRGLLALLGRLPFRWVGALGAAAGRLVHARGGREVRNARTNLALCFPDMSEQDREMLVRRNLMETGRSLAQMIRIWVGPRRDWADAVDDDGFYDAARALIARGRGLIIAMPHLGNWELIAYLAVKVAPASALYRPPRQAFLDDVVRQGRERSGLRPVPIDRQGLKALHGALQRGEIVGILPDQVPKTAGASGAVAPFFGHPALTMTLVNRLVRRHQSAVLFCCAVYDHGQRRYRIHHFEGEAAIGDPSAEAAAAALNRDVERCVRAFPAHYQWTYRRFEIPGDRGARPYARLDRRRPG